MSLILATGSNLGESRNFLKRAQDELSEIFIFISASRIYRSPAVDYEAQPDFFNQVLEYHLPDQPPEKVMEILLSVEKKLGRVRDVPKGPRTIDIDLLFWGTEQINLAGLVVPHPRWSERSFVVRPLSELPFFQTIKKCFTIPESFNVEATPL